MRHPEFRENPKRAVYVVGVIDQAMVDRLTPEILRLRSESSEPITVYIDSPGGSTLHAYVITQLLKSPTQDGEICSIVTVVTGQAASAAADLLTAGGYAIAYPHTSIHYHGVRTSQGEITHESALNLAESLKRTNEDFALELLDKIKGRFFFVYTQLKSDFSVLSASDANLSTVECLAKCLEKKLVRGGRLLRLALEKHQRLVKLLAEYNQELAVAGVAFQRPAEQEAFLLKFLIDWELKENSVETWRFGSKGLAILREDFILLSDFENGEHMKALDNAIEEWGMFLLEPEERQHYVELEPEAAANYVKERKRESFKTIWHFLISICRSLQQGENLLHPYEAYWLGLVDEIPGSHLATIREVVENFEVAIESDKTKGRQSKKVRSIAAKAAPKKAAKSSPKKLQVRLSGI